MELNAADPGAGILHLSFMINWSWTGRLYGLIYTLDSW
jgi:hypothetical protein